MTRLSNVAYSLRNRKTLIPIGLLAILVGILPAPDPTAASTPRPDHVVVAIMENHSYEQVMGSTSAPYINSLAQQNALFTQSFAVGHPSEPNYLALWSGSNQGVTDDSCPHTFTTGSLGTQLLAAGLSVAGYNESMPSDGYTGCGSGNYARKHSPMANWPATADASHNMTYAAWPTDFTTLPTVSLVVPNLCSDMHNCSIATGDAWLKAHWDPYVQWAKTHNSLAILTFDEDEGANGNHIVTIFAGQGVRPGQYAEHITHYNVLRTIEDFYGLAPLGNAASAYAIADIWTGVPAPSPSPLPSPSPSPLPKPPAAAPPGSGSLTLAVIGDYGCQPGSNCGAIGSQQEIPVRDLVRSWNPSAIITLGDNSYESGTTADINTDQNPYAAEIKAGIFFQVVGNHDMETASNVTGGGSGPNCTAVSSDVKNCGYYFNRPPHYVAHLGSNLVDLFSLDMNSADPGGDGATSAQASWYRAQVAASTAVWKITADHQPFYSSGEHGSQDYTHWGILPSIDLFLSGHDHDMEHLVYNGQNYVVDAVGGRNEFGFAGHPACPFTGVGGVASCSANTVWRDATAPYHFGAVRLTVTPTSLRVEFVAVGGSVLHSFTITKSGPGTSPSPSPTPQPQPSPSPSQPPSGSCNLTPPIRAAFYYPWYPENWTQGGVNPATKYHPTAGLYSLSGAGSAQLELNQIKAMEYGHIQAGIASWWGQGSPTDGRIAQLLSVAHGTPFCWTLYYEPALNPSQAASDLNYIASHYANDPSFLHVNGKPVLFVYSRAVASCANVATWQSINNGFYLNMQVFNGYRTCATQPAGWHQYGPAVAEDHQAGYSFSISPGFDKYSEAAPRLVRDPARWATNVADMVNSHEPWQLITTFNEWMEATAVESAVEWQSASGYGLYLDALHNT